MDPKGKQGIFLGYEENVKGYRIRFDDQKLVKVERNVIFTGKIRKENAEKRNDKEALLYLSNLEKDEEKDKEKDLPEEEDEQGHLPEEDDPAEEPENQNYLPDMREAENRRVVRDKANIKPSERYNDFLLDVLVAEGQEPVNFNQAINSDEADQWSQALLEEMSSLNQNQVWELVQPLKDKSIIKNRWVYKIKKDTNIRIIRYKARLVAKGNNQKEGIDYTETFSPVVRFASIRVILTMDANKNLILKQFDITAFLHGEIKEEIYTEQPKGFEDGTGRVCKVQKSLYGLKQSSRCCNKRFTQFLLKYGFVTKADPCIFKSSKDKILILAIHIDDGLVAAENEDLANQLI